MPKLILVTHPDPLRHHAPSPVASQCLDAAARLARLRRAFHGAPGVAVLKSRVLHLIQPFLECYPGLPVCSKATRIT
jgi:hypothetical protein